MSSDLSVYSHLLADIKTRIQAAQVRAMLAVNAELIHLYWEIGQILDLRQQQEGWGAGIIPKLAADLHNELPELKGFSERNLKRMLAFYRAYTKPEDFVPQAVAQTHGLKMPQPVALMDGENLLWQIPWGHHALLLEKVKAPSERCWYMMYSLMHGWSRNILAMQIETRAHLRQGQAVTNFSTQLLAPQSDLVQQTLKDPYLFDFLTLEHDFHERELETGLVRHVEKFLLQLGQGFAFVGRQYLVSVGEDDFYIDLLFYHLKLRCFVVIELKRGAFKPEYAGKINFYCNLVDDKLKHEQDQPTIGLLLCQDKNRAIAEYALRGIDKPIGVAEYQLMRELPETLASNLPSIAEIEAELGGEMGDSDGKE
ncbi:MAG: PDDEXK nuclease domain-containing protein [Methylovulum sp.]|uniref:PDDEXK nuclease domain-containing protein n=1 Tax=Methylovulum sp. TaxID=1916980 RepID=UPI00261E5EFE|nr:PDDEXK nuclease domain-containing protein [Methylovulum sp.]MDD2723423.1 PDDEXK nuclease domain-containing protein [Methylovulum sp.]MDD5125585.1 PDDEXK nuclease domain-containing protein [Methylovulum sp.]